MRNDDGPDSNRQGSQTVNPAFAGRAGLLDKPDVPQPVGRRVENPPQVGNLPHNGSMAATYREGGLRSQSAYSEIIPMVRSHVSTN